MKKLLLVEVPDGYEFTHSTMEIHNPTIPHLGATQYPEFKVIHLPTEEEIKKIIEEHWTFRSDVHPNQYILLEKGAQFIINKILNK